MLYTLHHRWVYILYIIVVCLYTLHHRWVLFIYSTSSLGVVYILFICKWCSIADSSWLRYDTSEYYISSETEDIDKTWYEARDWCMQNGADLASILSDGETKQISSWVSHFVQVGLQCKQVTSWTSHLQVPCKQITSWVSHLYTGTM